MAPPLNRTPHDAVELELIHGLSASLPPSIIMTAGFALAGGLIVWTEHDLLLLVLWTCGLVACAARIMAALRLLHGSRASDFNIERARVMERDFRVSHTSFAAVLGLFSVRAFMLPPPAIHMLTLCLLMGYAAGVAATVALRPRIAIPSMLMALVPTILGALLSFDRIYVAMALMTIGFLAGGIQNLRVRAARAGKEIALRIAFGQVARKDGLTALPNRVALAEWFQERRRGQADGHVAVHYLDLDGFKPINDRFGHTVGDALLTAVGKRITSTIRDSDLGARLGGDEFAVVQFGIDGEEAAERLAQRLSDAICRPYSIESRTVHVSASIGYVVMEQSGSDLEHLLNLADQALYGSKRRGGGVTRYQDSRTLNAA